MTFNLLVLGKTAILTLIISRFSKAIGKKEIAEIIEGIGILACGVCILVILSPVFKDIGQFGKDIHGIFANIHGFFQWIQSFGK